MPGKVTLPLLMVMMNYNPSQMVQLIQGNVIYVRFSVFKKLVTELYNINRNGWGGKQKNR